MHFTNYHTKIKKKLKFTLLVIVRSEYLIELKQKLNNLNLRKYFVITGYIMRIVLKFLKNLIC